MALPTCGVVVKVAPDKAAELRRIEKTCREAERVVADVEARIREVGGLPKVEPLQEIAGRLVKSGKASDDGLEKMARGEQPAA